jgi:AraC-like DNA-binding protein
MGKSLKYLADNLIMSPDFDRKQLHLGHSDAKLMREKDIVLSAMCEIKDECEVERKNPSVHVLIFSITGFARLFAESLPKKGKIIEPGQVAILPAKHWHHYRMEGKTWKAIWFYLADTQTWRQLREHQPLIRQSIAFNEILTAFEGYWSESLRNETRARLAIRHYAELIVLNLERELDMEESQNNKQMRQRLYQLWDTVGANLGRNWTVQELANEIGISPQHLYKVSQQYCNHKPMEMVTILRMQQAEEYLVNTDQMIKSIAYTLGYADCFSFSAAFKRYSGHSPREYRNKNLKNGDHSKRGNDEKA